MHLALCSELFATQAINSNKVQFLLSLQGIVHFFIFTFSVIQCTFHFRKRRSKLCPFLILPCWSLWWSHTAIVSAYLDPIYQHSYYTYPSVFLLSMKWTQKMFWEPVKRSCCSYQFLGSSSLYFFQEYSPLFHGDSDCLNLQEKLSQNNYGFKKKKNLQKLFQE